MTGLPLRVKLAEEQFRLRAVVALPAGDARLRLRLTWRNSSWETDVVLLERGELSRPPRGVNAAAMRSGTVARSGPAR